MNRIPILLRQTPPTPPPNPLHKHTTFFISKLKVRKYQSGDGNEFPVIMQLFSLDSVKTLANTLGNDNAFQFIPCSFVIPSHGSKYSLISVIK